MTKEELLQKKVSAISLGCDKNRVDLEKILFALKNDGFNIVDSPNEAQIVIVNTCAFILPAKQESIDAIIEMEFLKNQGKLEKILVTGCFPERNFEDLKQNFPNVDAFIRIKDNDKIPQVISNLYSVKESSSKKQTGRLLTTPGSYAFLKIAEGCNNACSYCIIPRIRGRYKSAEINKLIDEAETLVKNGVKEIILVAQDVSRYGEDLYGENKLIELLKKLVKIKELKWIRLHYLYPEKLTPELLEFINTEEKICKYIDVPLQHIDDKILKSMRRRLDEDNTRKLIANIKQNYKNLALRTTFIVGYPGETAHSFKKLCNFIQTAEFDYAGFFPYYKEENTASYFMKNQVSKFTKQFRLNKAKKLQSKIFNNKLKKLIGKEVDALIDGFDFNTGLYFGHTQTLSPNTDFGLLIEGENLKVGDIVKVKLTNFDGNNFGGVRIWIYQTE